MNAAVARARPRKFVRLESRSILVILTMSATAAGITACSSHHSSQVSDPNFADATPPIAAVDNESPVYPTAARIAGLEGVVKIKTRISAGGSVETAEVESGDEPFASAALEAVRNWRFTPAQRNGEPVASLAIIPIRFRLQPAWVLLLAPVSADASSLRNLPMPATFKTETECERAALQEKASIVVGCVWGIGNELSPDLDASSAPLTSGWSELILAPLNPDRTPILEASEDHWIRIGTFPKHTFCEMTLELAKEANSKRTDGLTIGDLEHALRCRKSSETHR